PSRAEGKRPRIEGVSGGHVVFPPGGGRFSIAILLHSVWPDRKCDQNGVSRTMTLFLRLLGSSAEGRVEVVPPLSRFAVAALPSFSERLSAVERRAASPSFERASSVLVDVRKAVVRPEGLSLSRCALATSDSVGSASMATGSGVGSDSVAGGGGGTWRAAAGDAGSTGGSGAAEIVERS